MLLAYENFMRENVLLKEKLADIYCFFSVHKTFYPAVEGNQIS